AVELDLEPAAALLGRLEGASMARELARAARRNRERAERLGRVGAIQALQVREAVVRQRLIAAVVFDHDLLRRQRKSGEGVQLVAVLVRTEEEQPALRVKT